MLSDETKNNILKTISLTGVADSKEARIKHIIGGNINHVVSLSSGMPRLQSNVVKRFNLILSQPLALQALNPFEIRCAFCRKVIGYPCWYYEVKYAVNHFHYFVCFDSSSPGKPSVKCYRRENV